jgi:hypothetical protein
MYIEAGVDSEPDAVVWINENGLHRAVLLAVDGEEPTESDDPEATGGDATPEPSE